MAKKKPEPETTEEKPKERAPIDVRAAQIQLLSEEAERLVNRLQQISNEVGQLGGGIGIYADFRPYTSFSVSERYFVSKPTSIAI